MTNKFKISINTFKIYNTACQILSQSTFQFQTINWHNNHRHTKKIYRIVYTDRKSKILSCVVFVAQNRFERLVKFFYFILFFTLNLSKKIVKPILYISILNEFKENYNKNGKKIFYFCNSFFFFVISNSYLNAKIFAY